ETKAPDGYVLDTTSQTVAVNRNDTQTLTFTNTPIGGGRIIKVDADSGKRIKGVQFEVTKMNGERIGVYTTDSAGVIILPQLADGWYTATEIKAADGYRLDTTPHNFEVKNGKTTAITIENSKASSILLHKIDSVTGKGIYGVSFLVSDANRNPVGTYTSDQNGYVYMDKELTDGKYYVREIEAAEGYILDTTVRSFYVRYGATSEITWENTPTMGQIQITKKSADDSPMNGLPAGTLLPGATFEIYTRSGRRVDTVKTGSNGVAISRTLPLGRYTVRETVAPAYYAATTQTFDAEIEFSGQIVRLEVTNQSVYTNVSVQKRGYVQVVPGQTIRYEFKNIANNSTVSLGSFYWRDTLPTDAVRLTKIVTGTWNQRLSYKVVFKTNLHDFRPVADNLSTYKNNVLDCSAAALGLAGGEYITQTMFVFGAVKPDFHQVEAPAIYCTVSKWLQSGYQFTNKTDVGGLWNGQWIMAADRWVTAVYGKPITLPKTGY
ncbi:MAG: SpaA isopeptide-forming pilin-related protein, partial [Oscillospiraceae bacterium]